MNFSRTKEMTRCPKCLSTKEEAMKRMAYGEECCADCPFKPITFTQIAVDFIVNIFMILSYISTLIIAISWIIDSIH